MPNLPLPRFLERHDQRRTHAAKLNHAVVSTTHDVSTKRHYADPADTLTLRGIPAIGRGVAGAIRGSNPESVAN